MSKLVAQPTSITRMNYLSEDVTLCILKYLDVISLAKCERVCKQMQQILLAQENTLLPFYYSFSTMKNGNFIGVPFLLDGPFFDAEKKRQFATHAFAIFSAFPSSIHLHYKLFFMKCFLLANEYNYVFTFPDGERLNITYTYQRGNHEISAYNESIKVQIWNESDDYGGSNGFKYETMIPLLEKYNLDVFYFFLILEEMMSYKRQANRYETFHAHIVMLEGKQHMPTDFPVQYFYDTMRGILNPETQKKEESKANSTAIEEKMEKNRKKKAGCYQS